MTSPNSSNNPFAFPLTGDKTDQQFGMTLRDYYVGQALAGLCANPKMADTEFELIATAANGIGMLALKMRNTIVATDG